MINNVPVDGRGRAQRYLVAGRGLKVWSAVLLALLLTLLVQPVGLAADYGIGVPLAELSPHQDPEVVNFQYDGTTFLKQIIEVMDGIIDGETSRGRDTFADISTANLPEEMVGTQATLIILGEHLEVRSERIADDLDLMSLLLEQGSTEELQALSELTGVQLVKMGMEIEAMEAEIFEMAQAMGAFSTVSDEGETLLTDINQQLIQLNTRVDQNQTATDTLREQGAQIAELGLPSPELSLAIVPGTAYVGDEVVFEGALSLDGRPLADRSLQIQLDGINLGSPLTGADGSFQGSLHLPQSYTPEAFAQAVYIPAADDAGQHLPGLSPTVPVKVRYYGVELHLDTPDRAYPGRNYDLRLGLDYGDAPPLSDRRVEVLLDEELVATFRAGVTADITLKINPDAELGPHLLKVTTASDGRYAGASLVNAFEVRWVEIALELERPQLAFLPGSVGYRGRIISELGPVVGAEVLMKLGEAETTAVTNRDGFFSAKLEVGVVGGLVGREVLLVQVAPTQPRHPRLTEDRHQVVVNLVNCVLLGVLVLLAAAFLPVWVSRRQTSRQVAPWQEPKPVAATNAVSPPTWVESGVPATVSGRILYWYRRSLFLVQRVTGNYPGRGQTLREFARDVSQRLGPAGRSFLAATRVVERIAYSTHRPTAAEAQQGEATARRIDAQRAAPPPDGDEGI